MTRPIRPIRIEGDVAYVTLTQGYEAIIDAADTPLVEGVNWYANVHRNTVYCVNRSQNETKKTTIRMHRVIMGDPDGFQIDHIDGDGLNNRKSNLRLATRSENARNRRINKNSTSGLKGAFWVESRKRWRAEIKADGKKINLGYFNTPEAAYAAYVAASEKLHGEFARAA
jgi:hypothetical protein